ncbi:MAG: hypothetical protein KF864_01305 [Phycisphaeraceae bacterium]|nr:hypothetical protein [Phycisphaeraceae bacterium]
MSTPPPGTTKTRVTLTSTCDRISHVPLASNQYSGASLVDHVRARHAAPTQPLVLL